MRKQIILGFVIAASAAAVAAVPVGAKVPGPNGRIVFARFDPALGNSVIYTANPDGSSLKQLEPFGLQCPHWSTDGSLIVTCGLPDGSSTVFINPDTGTYRELFSSEPSLFLACSLLSPAGKRLACGQFNQPADTSRDGIYTIRSSDGAGLERVTTNPGGSDDPGDYSPNGKRLVFGRYDQNSNPVGLFVVNINGIGLKPITPAGTLVNSSGDWSPQGNEIVFSRHLSPDAHSSLWVVHADGTGLREIHVEGVACGGPNGNPDGIACFDPRWSPDGKKLAFVLASAAGSNIYTINADGSDLTQVTNGGADDSPDWGTHRLAG